MTENEAIYVLKMIETNSSLPAEVKELSIKALEEVQRYRVIKTKLEGKLTDVETELKYLQGVDHHILLAEREYLLGKQVGYATAISIIEKGADYERT